MNKIFTIEHIKEIASFLLEETHKKELEEATVLAFSGELGSGKTTLTQEIARQLGVKEKLVSPTFVIMKKYKVKDKKFKNLIHIDAYRLDKGEDLEKIGWEKIVKNKENLIIIEWPERVRECIDKNALKVFLEHKDKDKRKIKILV